MNGVRILQVTRFDEAEILGLCAVLIDCVQGGASVSFMPPMSTPKAMAYWRGAAASAGRGERIVLAALDAEQRIVGTVQVVLQQPENQPHRGEISKMLVHRSARRRGVGNALMSAAETAARQAGKTLLVLDTASADAERLYTRHGWTRCGVIPNYALWPDGTPGATTIFYKVI